MKMNDSFVKKVHFTKAEQYRNDLVHFGYTVTGEFKKGNKVVFTVTREPSVLVKKLSYYEKQYVLINKKVFPLAAIILLVLGTIGLILGLSFAKTIPFLSIGGYVLMAFFYSIALFAIIAFIILKIKRKKLTLEILKRCDQIQGFAVSELPNNVFDNTQPLPQKDDPSNKII